MKSRNKLAQRKKKSRLGLAGLFAGLLKGLVPVVVVASVAVGGMKLTHFSAAAEATGTVDFVTYDGTNKQTQCTGPTRQNMRRFYNGFLSTGGDHFYTMDKGYVNGTNGWGIENEAAWYAPTTQIPGTLNFYRMWNNADNVKNHFYTTSFQELQDAAAYGWQYEGTEGFIASSQQPGTIPLYHVYNSKVNDHVYTTDMGEIDLLRNKYEYGYYIDASRFIAGYVWTNDGNSCTTTSIFGGNEIGSVSISTNEAGSGAQCSPRSGTTFAGSGPDHGHLRLTCPGWPNNSPRKYIFQSANRNCWTISNSSPHKPGNDFSIYPGQTTTYSLIMDRTACDNSPPPPPPQSGGGGGTKAPSGGGGGSTGGVQAPAPSPSSGKVQVTAYTYNKDGSRTRIGGLNVHIQAAGYATTDTGHNCSNYNQTTDSSGTANNNQNFGQVHFTNCWTGSGKQNYQLSFVQIPPGLSLRSFRITGPGGVSFASGTSVKSGNIAEQFAVVAGQETQLEIWLNKGDSGGDNTNLRQVVTQTGVRYIGGSAQDSKSADILNKIIKNPGEIPPSPAGDDDDKAGNKPPSKPANFRAVQDDSGAVTLSWKAASGEPGEEITYTVDRSLKSTPEETDNIDDSIEGLTTLDDGESLTYPQTYIYTVYAEDSELNDSEKAVLEFTTVPVRRTVDDSKDGIQLPGKTTTESGATQEPTFTMESPDKNARMVIGDDDVDEDLSCDIADSSSEGTDLLSDTGKPADGNVYTPVCRDADGDLVDKFDDDIDVSVDIDNEDLEDGAELYAFDGTDWVMVPTKDIASKDKTPPAGKKRPVVKYASATRTRGKTKTTYSLKTENLYSLAVINPQRGSFNFFKILFMTAGLLILMIGLRYYLARRLIPSYDTVPYGDIDLMPQRPYANQPAQTQAPQVIVSPAGEPPHKQAEVYFLGEVAAHEQTNGETNDHKA